MSRKVHITITQCCYFERPNKTTLSVDNSEQFLFMKMRFTAKHHENYLLIDTRCQYEFVIVLLLLLQDSHSFFSLSPYIVIKQWKYLKRHNDGNKQKIVAKIIVRNVSCNIMCRNCASTSMEIVQSQSNNSMTRS